MRSNGRFRIMLSIVLSAALALGQTPATAGRALAAEPADPAAQAPASTPDDAAGTTAPEAELPGGAALTQALSADANEAGESAASVDPVSEPTAATPDATATPGAIPASDPTSDATAAPASDATTADPAPTPESVSRPALDWVGSAANGAIVSVHAPEGALPEGTVPSVASATPEQARAALDASSALLDGEPVDALAVDISFTCAGAEVEPAPGSAVQVTLRSIASVSGTRFSCVHVADDGSAEVVAAATPTHAEFSSDSFSVYAIVGEDAQVRARVAFVSATSAGAVTGATLSTQIVRAGDTLEAPAPPAAAAEKSVFSHWSIGTGTDVVDVAPWLGRALSNDDIASLATVAGATFDPATNLYDLTATATFAPAHTVRFHQYGHDESVAEADLDATDAYSSLTDASGSIDLSAASLSFTPIVEGVDAHLVGWASFAPGALAGAAPLASYDTDAVVTGVSSDLDLYPVLSTGFTVTLDTRSAATLESLFVAEDATGTGTLAFDRLPTAESLGTNFNPGYTFAGWYSDDSFETKVESDISGIRKDLTLYAKWDPATVTYTIVNMLEGPENKPGEGRYTFYSSEVAYGVVGTHVPLPTEGSTTYAISNADGTTRNESFMGYHIPDSDEKTAYGSEVVLGDKVPVNAYSANALISEETIDPSGTTTVKLYWNRNRLAIRFFTNSSKTTQLATDTYIKYGQKVKTFEHGNSLHNFLATYKSGKGRFINVLEVAPYVLDADGDMAFLHTGDSDVSISQLVDKFSRDSFPDNWSWVYQYVSFDYMKCMPGVDYSGKTVVSRTVQGATSNYYMMKSTIEVTQRAAGVHRGADNAAWVGGTAYDTRGYLVAANMRDGMHDLGTGASYRYAGKGLIANSSWPGGYGCELFYHPYTYVLSFANTVGSSVNPTEAEETSVNRDYGSLVSSDGAVSKYVVGETTREANGRDYVFDGWYVDASAAANHLQPDRGDYRIDPATWTMPDANTALYAGWTPKSYDVTFDSVGGQMVEQEGAVLSEDGSKLTLPEVEGGTTVAKPETPTKTVGGVDYTFTGWYKDPDYTEPWVFSSSTPHGPTTLYAKWVKGRTYHVTYHTSEGAEIAGVDDTLYRYGARARVAPEQPGESHDEPFLGWSTVKGNASYLVGQSVTVNAHTDLFAIYGSALPGAAAGDVEEGAPRVTLHSNYASLPEGDRPGAEVESTIQAERANAAVTLPSGIAGADATGYHVSGWSTSPDGSGDTYGTGEAVAVASDTDLFAVWKANQLSADLSASFVYDGTEREPEPTVTGWDGSTLSRGTDYELSWSDNVRAHPASGDGAPTVTVRGLGDYKRSEPATATFEIARRRVTLTADNKSSGVGEDIEELTYRVTSGSVVDGDDLSLAPFATAPGGTEPTEIVNSAIGTYDILVSYTANPDYEVTVVRGTYRVSAASLRVTAQGWSGTYDGVGHQARVALAPEEAVRDGACVYYSTTTPLDDSNYSTSGSTDVPSRTRAGTTTVYYYVKGTESYKPDDDDRAGSLELSVAKAPLVATALPRTITYGEEPANGGLSWAGFVPGESESNLDLSGLSFSYDSLAGGEGSGYAPGSPAGSYRISASGADAANYDISYAPGTLTVARRPLSLVWSAADSMPYTGSVRTYAGATLAGLWGSDVVSCDLSGASETHAGEYVATVTGLTGAMSSSYSLPGEGLSHPWSVTRAANSATAAIDDWTYGQPPAAPTAIAGFGAATATFEYADAAEGPFAPDPPASAGTHWVRAVVPGTPDYEGAESPAKAFEVARRPVSIEGVAAAGKVYDGTAAAPVSGEPSLAGVPGAAASGPVAGDDVAVSPGTASFDGPSAGSGRSVTFSGWSLSGAAAANYELAAQPAGATADISPRPARVVARPCAVAYGDEPPAYAADWENLAPGEGPADAATGTLTLSCDYARWSDAGEYEVVPSGVTATANYELELVPGALSVARAGNRWVAGPSMASWTLGEPVPAPVAEAAFGEAALSFAPALSAQDEGDGWSPDVPTAPGSYVMRAEVEGTPNYSGLSAEVPFSVSAATLSYDANSPLAEGSVAPAEGAVGESVEVAGAGGLAWPGHSFRGWNAAPDGSGDAYQPGDGFVLTGGPDVLYAQWLPAGELRYEGNGADSGETPPNLGNAGEVVRAAACGFSRVGCRFAGWSGSADGSGARVMPGDAVTLVAGGQRLFAQWTVNEISAALAGGPFVLPADGSGARPRPEVLGWDGRALSEGVDYELSWADNLAPTAGGPRATVTVTPLPGTEHALARPVTLEFDVVAAAQDGPAAAPADRATPATGDPSTLAAPALAAVGLAAVAASLRRRRRSPR